MQDQTLIRRAMFLVFAVFASGQMGTAQTVIETKVSIQAQPGESSKDLWMTITQEGIRLSHAGRYAEAETRFRKVVPAGAGTAREAPGARYERCRRDAQQSGRHSAPARPLHGCGGFAAP